MVQATNKLGREADSAQSFDEGIFTITEASLPHLTSVEVFWIRNCVA